MPLRVEVEWLDSGVAHLNGWEPRQQIVDSLKITPAFTVGYLVHQSEDTVYVALTFDPDRDMFVNAQAIQRASVIRMTPLRARGNELGKKYSEEDDPRNFIAVSSPEESYTVEVGTGLRISERRA